MDADIVIVGAGFAGLSAADMAVQHGLKPLVVESRERVGGRTMTRRLDNGLWLDLGGQWIGPGQEQMYLLAKRFGREVWPMQTAGKQILDLGGKIKRYSGLIPLNLSPLALANVLWGFQRLERMARRVPIDEPWKAKNAAWLDQRTLGDWLRSNMLHAQARSLMQIAIEAVFAAHPDDIGLLHALRYLNSGGGLERLTSSAGGAQQDRIDGGMQSLAEDWQEELSRKGVAFHFEQPIQAIHQSSNQVDLIARDSRWKSRFAIITVPPAIAAEIDFIPSMPSERLAWCQAMIPGRVIKGFAIYDQPFWRKQGLCGQAVSDRPPVHVVFDASPPGIQHGILLGFIEGREAIKWSQHSADQRREAMVDCFARCFGPLAFNPLDYIDHDWTSEHWSRGCYAGVAGPGVTTTVAQASRTVHGRVHWAGTETATHWNGYIEGAVQSGQRAVREVVAAD